MQACNHPPPAIPAGTTGGWSAWGGTPGGGHFAPTNQINRENVHALTLAWTHRSGDVRIGRPRSHDERGISQSSFQATPILINDTLYYCSAFNKVFALNARTGEERWRFDPEVDHYADWLPNCRGVSFWSSPDAPALPEDCSARIIVGTLDARLIAIDAATGSRCTDFGNNGEVDLTNGLTPHTAAEYSVTSPPAILGNTVITGAMVLDNVRTDAPSGVVRAFDVRTGRQLWAWNPVPPDMEGKTSEDNYRPGTTNVWSVLSVDAERNLVFVPTGNTSPDYYGGHRNGLDAYSSSVVALNGATGEVVWHFQTVHHDIWDYDVPAQPTLTTLNIDGEDIPVVVQVTKMGMTFVLHRDTGKPVFGVEERPVPQTGAVEGEYLSPTQPFPLHVPTLYREITEADAWGFTPWDKSACRKQIASLRNEGIYTPPSLQGSIFYPSNAGGNNWGSPAIHPDTGIMIVATTRVPNFVRLSPRAACEGSQQLGTPYCSRTEWLTSPLGAPCTEPPWGTLDAIDLVAGKLLWSVPLGTSRHLAPFPMWWLKGTPTIGGPLLTAGDVVFAGATLDHYFRAIDAATGEELWRYTLPTAANSVPMAYQLPGDDRQFVVIAVGGHWGGSNPPGDHLMAFALPR